MNKNRKKLIPVLNSVPGLAEKMVSVLHSGSARYSREYDRAFSQIYLNAGTQAIEDLLSYYVLEKAELAQGFITITETFYRGLPSRDFSAVVAPILEKQASRFTFTNDQSSELKKILPNFKEKQTTSAQGISAMQTAVHSSTKSIDKRGIDDFLSRADLSSNRSRMISESEKAKWITEFLELAPDGEALKKLENSVNKRAFAESLRRAAYQRTTSAAQFIDFSGSAFNQANESYLKELDERIAENIESFTRHRPSDDEMISLMKKFNFRGASFQDVADFLVLKAKSASRFAAAIDNLHCLRLLSR